MEDEGKVILQEARYSERSLITSDNVCHIKSRVLGLIQYGLDGGSQLSCPTLGSRLPNRSEVGTLEVKLRQVSAQEPAPVASWSVSLVVLIPFLRKLITDKADTPPIEATSSRVGLGRLVPNASFQFPHSQRSQNQPPGPLQPADQIGGDGSLWTIFDSCGAPRLPWLLARSFDAGLADLFFARGRLRLGLVGMASGAGLRFAINSCRHSSVKT